MAEPLPALDALHGFRAPAAPESIAPYLVAVLSGVVFAVLAVAILRTMTRRRARLRRAAAEELIRTRTLAPPERLAAQAALLRRIARAAGLAGQARLQGAAWLAQLDELFATSFFSQSEGRVFGTALYSPHDGPDIEKLDGALAGLIARLRPRRARP